MSHETNTTAFATPDVATSARMHADPGRTSAAGSRRRWVALAVLMLPVLLVFLYAQQYIVEGIAAGAVKG